MQIKNFKELCENHNLGKSTFLELSEKLVSYDYFLTNLRKIASVPSVYDLPAGSRVLVSLKNDLELITTTIGLIASGITVVLVDPETKQKRIETIAKTATINGWVIDKENAVKWSMPEGKLNIEIEELSQAVGVISKLLKSKENKEKFTFQRWLNTLMKVDSLNEIPLETRALILFTSGTTSDPKGVPLTHKNILSHLVTLTKQYKLDRESNIHNILPLYHVDGFIQGPLLTLFNRARLVRPFRFEVNKVENLFYSIYKYRITHFFVVPTILQILLKFGSDHSDAFKTDEFKYVISSAGVLDATLWMSFVEFFSVDLLNVYGLTESVAGGLFCGPEDGKCRSGSIGRPVDIETRVIDEYGKDIKDHQVGELLMKGDNIMDSYLNPSDNPDTEGWFHTGDLVYQDKDGFYYIKGRIKNVIIKGGINVYAEEVVEAINLHSDISDSFVLGVSDEQWGEKVVAIIEAPEKKLTDDIVLSHLGKVTESKNFPDSIIYVDSIPKGNSGKVSTDEVRNLVSSTTTTSETRKEINSTEIIKSTILKIASECFANEITPDQYSFNSLKIEGWNSLAHLQLVTLIEKNFKVKLSVKDIMNITSLKQAEEIVREKLD